MELLTPEEAAAFLKMTPKQLYELTRSRSLSRQEHPSPFLKIGKVRRFRLAALQEWILKLEQK